MVGGGQENEFGKGKTPNNEFMLRSIEASALMPMMQFSYAAWKHCEAETSGKVRAYAGLRRKYADYIRTLMEECTRTMDPLMRNLEYEFPGAGLERVTDEFMLGSKLLVAPVLTAGTDRRAVALPPGAEWRYVPTGKVYAGGGKVTVPAPLDVLPYFERV